MVMHASEASALRDRAASQAAVEAGGGGRRRVLYVVSAFPCWSETFIVREIHALLRRGVDVRVVALRRSREALVQTDAAELLDRALFPRSWSRNLAALAERLRRRPAATLALPLRIVARLWRQPEALLKSLVAWFRMLGLLRDIENFAPGHVHAHWATYASTAARFVAEQVGATFSFTAHAHDIYVNDQLMREKLGSAAFVATISRFNREYLRHRYREADGARIEIVHCGVPRRERAAAKPPAAQREPGMKTILSVGRLDEIKGFPTLLEACALLREQGVDFRCQVVGDGPLRAALAQQLRQLGLGRHVQLLGALASQEVERRMAQADVFVLASQRARSGNMDGIPVALMEAMASRTPVVSTAVSGIPELVEDGRTGLLVPPRDAPALAAAIRRLFTDDALRERCVAGAERKVRQEFDADTEAERLFGLISSLAGEGNAEKVAHYH